MMTSTDPILRPRTRIKFRYAEKPWRDLTSRVKGWDGNAFVYSKRSGTTYMKNNSEGR
jgi:hypothetical protein